MRSIPYALLSLTLCSISAVAADVDTKLSTRETYVGRPVVLQISIQDASQYQEPTLPDIDGCDIQSSGTPQQMSQITIINGRRSVSRSVTLEYRITPRREGTFTIPPLSLQVDGKSVSTQSQRFVASRSETGDLMFVEIDGGKERVFVGQPLDLTLKIWIKPFRDSDTGQTLSEGDMWNRISPSSSWGGFTDRMQELAKNNQRPGGEEILRDDGTGHERSYYLYHIPATVYPKRAGEIDASDVRIVVDYPVELGQARSPFGGLLADDFFGGRSPFSQMLDDEFFNSPFGNRLAITKSRPIVGDVSVDATEVLPVPMAGRPVDYRGAVGRYRILTQATPVTVDAGDPINLKIGIVGNGPMESVQGPPLETMAGLTKDFKVPDQSLAGFVQDDVKVFATTIRPRRAGITEIPPIQFSFFNPDTEQYESVTSEPITVTVNESETLALDAIVDGSRGAATETTRTIARENLPDFTNHTAASVLITQPTHTRTDWWWAFVIAPPIVWLGVVMLKSWPTVAATMAELRSPKARCLATIDRADDADEVKQAVVAFVLRRTRARGAADRAASDGNSKDSASQAVGALRLSGLYPIASEVESFLSPSHSIGSPALQDITENATTLVERVDAAIDANKLTRVKRNKPRRSAALTSQGASGSSLKSSTARLLVMAVLVFGASGVAVSAQSGANSLTLSPQQQSTLLSEATAAYERGIANSKTDSADAKQSLAEARTKYQMLVDSGIHNAELYINLGNADLQIGNLGHAIANYEKALRIDPDNSQVQRNLAFANKKVEGEASRASSATGVRRLNIRLTELVGADSVRWTLALSSLIFWGLMIFHQVYHRFPVWRWALVPLVLFLVSLSSVLVSQFTSQYPWNAVMVADSVPIHAGDGDNFEAVATLDPAQGHRVRVLDQRGSWSRVRTSDGRTGWVHHDDVEIVSET